MQIRALALTALVPVFAALAPPTAAAQDRAGEFDHYLLALSWIPAWCAVDGDQRRDPRCGTGSAIGWALHGLWPQNRAGDWPEYCRTSERDPSRIETAAQAAIFGTSGAAWHQWNKHGRCSGLSAQAYYDLAARALAGVTLPEVFEAVSRPLNVRPSVVESAFIEANPGLTQDMMVTSCARGDLVELRLCLTRDLEPMPCDPALIRRECRLEAARLLPLR